MKVTPDINGLHSMIRAGTGVDRSPVQQQSRTFKDTLSTLNQSNYMEKLTGLSEDISKQGEIIGRRYDILELKKFKELIAEYLHEAVRFMYEFKKQSIMDARGRHRVYALIRKINEKLEELTRQVVEKEKDAIALLASIGDIKGMLVDILA